MGAALAQFFAMQGLSTGLADQSLDLASAGRERAMRLTEGFEEDGLVVPGTRAQVEENLTAYATIEDATDRASLVIEAVAEDSAVKKAVLQRIEASVAPSTVIATNTSALPIGALADAISNSSRFLGTHWFNPPQWIPCVEVIAGPDTSRSTIDSVSRLLKQVGKLPVTVGDTSGFVANRLQLAMFREAVAVVEEGIASPESVDAVIRSSIGFRLPLFGPFELADMAGLDIYAAVFTTLQAAFGDRFATPESLRRLVEAGRLGTKANGGYLDAVTGADSAITARMRDAAYARLAMFVREIGDGSDEPS
jgi:3-hydroxybutyryl-CoA dehydrogenase